jgi:hypothetical protein
VIRIDVETFNFGECGEYAAHIAGAVIHNGCPFGNIAAEVGASDPVLAKRADDAFCGLAGFLRQALHDAQARGQLARHVDLQVAADALVAYFEGIALLAKTRNDPSLILRLGPRAVQLAIAPSPRSPRRQRPRSRKRDPRHRGR